MHGRCTFESLLNPLKSPISVSASADLSWPTNHLVETRPATRCSDGVTQAKSVTAVLKHSSIQPTPAKALALYNRWFLLG